MNASQKAANLVSALAQADLGTPIALGDKQCELGDLLPVAIAQMQVVRAAMGFRMAQDARRDTQRLNLPTSSMSRFQTAALAEQVAAERLRRALNDLESA